MPPTVGYVAKVFPRLSETFVVNEIRQLERDGVEVQVFSLHPPPEEVPHRLLADLRAPITIVDQLGEPRPSELREAATLLRDRLAAAAVPVERLLPRKYVRLALQLADVAARLPLLRLHAHFASRAGHIAMLVSQLLGIPYSFTAHAKDIYHEEVDLDLLRAKMRFADLVVTVSDYNRRALLARGEGLPALEQKLVRLYNGVDLQLFRPDPAGERPPHRILGIGRLVEKKGFPTLVGACEILRRRGVQFTCELIGAGPQEPLLRDRIAAARLGDVVALRGPLPLEQVAAEMRAASVVALPCLVASDGNVDALPTVLLEAMACGVPVISTRLSGIPEIVADAETGFLVAPGDEVGLADALERVLTDPGAARRLGQAARARAERLFDLRANVAVLQRCFAAAQGSPVAA